MKSIFEKSISKKRSTNEHVLPFELTSGPNLMKHESC